ncbi:MAG: hypothetical protein RR048_06510, partial [Oscillospiraceae bacterium]
MKKLFAGILASTMVAGMAVSAFAYVDAKGAQSGTGITPNDTDYALQNKAYIDGKEAKEGQDVSGGDKIYYPILVVDEDDAGSFKYANRASEVDGLKVKLDNVNGGKYIKGTSIVRKDAGAIKVTGVEASKASFEMTIGAPTIVGNVTDLTITINGVENNITLDDAPVTSATTAAQLATAIAGKLNTVTIDGKAFAITANGDKLVGTASADGKTEITAGTFAIAKTADDGTNTITTAVTGKLTNGTDKVDAVEDQKIYCVEVALNDYFGTTDLELDFELSLRTRTIEYNSKDQNGDAPMSFTLGKESAKLSVDDEIVKKFRNGELTLSIDENTGSVRLDEMATGDAIEHIYLEGKDAPFTFDVKASGQGDLYLEVNQKANKKVTVSNQDAKLTFVNFPGKPEFDFTGTAKFSVEDPDVDYYFYEIVEDKVVKTSAKYNKEDETFDLRTRTLGSYIISDKELEATTLEELNKPTTDKPSTGGTT